MLIPQAVRKRVAGKAALILALALLSALRRPASVRRQRNLNEKGGFALRYCCLSLSDYPAARHRARRRLAVRPVDAATLRIAVQDIDGALVVLHLLVDQQTVDAVGFLRRAGQRD